MKELYERLGVSPNASQEEIREAYKKRSRMLHPDRGGKTEDMQRLIEAYHLLTNSEALKKWEAEHPEANDSSGYDFLDLHGERPSEQYRRTLKVMFEVFEQTPLKKMNSIDRIKDFQELNKPLMSGLLSHPQYQNLYRIKEDNLVYENLYDYIAHQTKWSNSSQPLASSYLVGMITLEKGFDIFLRFLSGEFYGKNLEAVIRYVQQQAIFLKGQTYDSNFYEAIVKIMSVRDLAKDYQQVAKALDEINSFIYQRHLMEKTEVIALIQNKYFRFFVATVLKHDWQGSSFKSPAAVLLSMKSELDYLRRLIPMSRVHLNLEEKVQKLISAQADIKESCDLGYLLIDLMVTSITAFSRINTGIMAALCFHYAATLETNEAKTMALEFLSLCLYQGAIAKAFNTNVLVAFYTSNQVIKCLNLLQYDQSTLSLDTIRTFLIQPGDRDLLNYAGSVHASISGTIKRAMYLVDIVPFYLLPKSTLDCELIEIFQLAMLRTSLNSLLAIKEEPKDFDYAKIIYHAYELALLNWCSEERHNQSNKKVIDLKIRSIEALLKAEKVPLSKMAELLDKPFISMRRDSEGWFDPDHTLNFPEEAGLTVYSDFHGLEFDENTLEFRFITEEWNKNKPNNKKLVNSFDIGQMLYFGITGALLSLDHHDPNKLYDPIQTVYFQPAQIVGTEYLKTLLMTDYLLKIFTTGAEISSQPPYLIRSSDELLAPLPEYLQKILKICKEDPSSAGHCHRFWITAGKMDRHKVTENGCKKIVYADPEMSVQKHLLTIGPDGKLQDAVFDSEDESKEAIFAREMTKHYKEIGEYFPEFLRLIKLVKIAAAISELSKIRLKNLFKLEHNKKILADEKFWQDYSAKSLPESTTNLRQSYETLSADFRQLLQGLRPISDTGWWEKKYQTIYSETCDLLSKIISEFPKFSFSLNDNEVVTAYNNYDQKYNEQSKQLFDDNYQTNKNSIIQKYGIQAWNANEQKIASDLRTRIAQDLGAKLTQQSILDNMNQGRAGVKKEIRTVYYSAFIGLKNSIGEASYSSLIDQFIGGNYAGLAAAIARDKINHLKITYNQTKTDHYSSFKFLEANVGGTQLSAHIEQLLLGNIAPLATALAQHKTAMVKTECQNQLKKQEKLEEKFLQMQFEVGKNEIKEQKYFVPAVYYAADMRRVYGGVSAFPFINKVKQLSRDLQSPFKYYKESAIKNAEEFVRKAGLTLGTCFLASSAYAQSYSELRSLEQDIRKAQSEIFWLELNERNERNRPHFNLHENQFKYTLDFLDPKHSSFFQTNPFAVYRFKAELEKGKQTLTTLSQQPELKPYFSAQRIFSNLYNAVENYSKGIPNSHLDGFGRGITHAFLDIANLIIHPLDNLLYPVSDLVYDATIIAAHHNILYSENPDIKFLRSQLIADPTRYNEAVKRMELRGEGISATLDYYRNAKAEEYTKEITRILAPGYFLKAAKTLGTLPANLKNFNQLHVPLFDVTHKMKLVDISVKTLSKEEVKQYGRKYGSVKDVDPLMYVITEEGEVIITEPIYDHWHLNNGKPVAAAGDIYVNADGLIYQIDNRSGSYVPSHPGLSSLVVKKFQNAGFTEVIDSTFCDWNKKMQEFERIAVQKGYPPELMDIKPKMYRPYLYPSFYGVSFGAGSVARDPKEKVNSGNPSEFKPF
jgi:curved DNA-binding protein CbpA